MFQISRVTAAQLTRLCSHRYGEEQQLFFREEWLTFAATMWKRKILDVYRAPFPLYSVKVDPKTGLVITAGGGGASKTGIKNAVVSTAVRTPDWKYTSVQCRGCETQGINMFTHSSDKTSLNWCLLSRIRPVFQADAWLFVSALPGRAAGRRTPVQRQSPPLSWHQHPRHHERGRGRRRDRCRTGRDLLCDEDSLLQTEKRKQSCCWRWWAFLCFSGLNARAQKRACSDLRFLYVCAAKSSQQAEVRRRAGKGERSGATEAAAADDEVSEMKEESAHISVTTLAELQSDLNPQDPLQKVVRFSPDMSLLLTGGTDGHLRVWEVNAPLT